MDACDNQERQPVSDRAIAERLAAQLKGRPRTSRAMAALAELLADIHGVEQRLSGGCRANGAGPVCPVLPVQPQDRRASPDSLVPVLGRAAAAVPQFWANPAEGEGLTNQLAGAMKSLESGVWVPAKVAELGARSPGGEVALVQLAEPRELGGLTVYEVLASAWMAQRWPGAFALRVAGDSMLPVLGPDDLVVVSPEAPAVNGEPAVVQLAGQIGVTCKVYRRAGGQVRLIPLKAACSTSVHPVREVAWALRVLARVRLWRRKGISRYDGRLTRTER